MGPVRYSAPLGTKPSMPPENNRRGSSSSRIIRECLLEGLSTLFIRDAASRQQLREALNYRVSFLVMAP